MDKDVNEEKKEAVVVGTFKIEMRSDGNVNVSGPIKNPVLVLDVFGRALASVAGYVTSEMDKSGGKSIEERS